MRHLSVTSVIVLRAIVDGVVYGFDLIDTTGLPSGTVYPALSRLERDSLVRSSWEDERVARAEGRPARRYYRVTAAGKRALAAAVEHYRARLAGIGRPAESER